MNSSDSSVFNVSRENLSPKRALPLIALSMTAVGLVTSIVLAILVILGIVDVPFDAEVLPWAAFAGLLPFCVGSLIVACVSWFRHRDGRSIGAIVLGLFAVAAALGALFVIVATGIANHPI